MSTVAGYQRIVCLTEETTETLYLLGQADRIVGISGFTVRPARARKEKPRVSAFTSAKLDRILELSPDLVLGFSDLQADIAADLIRAGIEVHVFNQRTVAGILTMIRHLGAMVEATAAAAELIESLQAHIESVAAAGRALPYRPRVYFQEWDNPQICGIRWVSELIEMAGGQDCFSDLARAPDAASRIISDSSVVVARSPEVIIGSWCGKKFRPERLYSDPVLAAVPAVQRDALYEIKSPLILQPGPAALTDGLDALQCIIKDVALRFAR